MKPGYLEVVESPRRMKGKGAPRDTLFGVIGHTKMDPMAKSLGGLLISTTMGESPKKSAHGVSRAMEKHDNTEKKLLGPAGKTHIAGSHHGQIPFAGKYMAPQGPQL
jgi:hypothetical protein